MDFKRGDHVTSDSFPGVALWYIGHPKMSQDFYSYDDDRYSLEEALVVMVGDDFEHRVHIDSLKRLDEDAFCGGCGQIGCAHG